MSNPYFQFKQFTVYHDRCAMKVGTDGVLLGAWTDVGGVKKILDVGTGSGLISLMLAQRNKELEIDAIDIDCDAIIQTKENVEQSPFSSKIQSYNISLQDFANQSYEKYDLIVSNPPFFTQSLKSPEKGRILARHTDSLLMEELIAISSELLSESGKFSIIYPFDCKAFLLKCGEQNELFTSRITNVYPTRVSLEPKRVLIEFSKSKSILKEYNLIIEESRHVYTEDFKNLLKEYYLKM